MPLFEIHTEEHVHGVYQVEAESAEQVRTKFAQGEITKPVVYEAVDADIESISPIE